MSEQFAQSGCKIADSISGYCDSLADNGDATGPIRRRLCVQVSKLGIIVNEQRGHREMTSNPLSILGRKGLKLHAHPEIEIFGCNALGNERAARFIAPGVRNALLPFGAFCLIALATPGRHIAWPLSPGTSLALVPAHSNSIFAQNWASSRPLTPT